MTSQQNLQQQTFNFISNKQAYKNRRHDCLDNIQMTLTDIIDIISFGNIQDGDIDKLIKLKKELVETQEDKKELRLLKDEYVDIKEQYHIAIQDEKEIKNRIEAIKNRINVKGAERASQSLEKHTNKFIKNIENNKSISIQMFYNLEQEVLNRLCFINKEDALNIKTQLFEVKKDFMSVIKYNKLIGV